jgi:hypothetical protein
MTWKSSGNARIAIFWVDIQEEKNMLNKRLVAEAAARLKNPVRRTPERDRMLFASMTAESLKLEGINTSTEDVLAAVEATEVQRAHAVA